MQLAVYGTLKKGYHNHRYLNSCVCLGGGWVENFALADEGYYPSAFRFPGNKIWVEVYEIDDTVLANCDKLEGVDSGYYSREKVNTPQGEAYMYARCDQTFGSSTGWFPQGIWEGGRSYRTAWLGWPTEIKLAKQAEARRQLNKQEDRRGPGILVDPPTRGRMKKIWHPESDEYEYVPWDEAEGKPTGPPEPPREPTKREVAQTMIKEGMEKNPKLPDERVA